MRYAKKWYIPVDDYMDMFYIHNVPNITTKPIIESIDVDSTMGGALGENPAISKDSTRMREIIFSSAARDVCVFWQKEAFAPKRDSRNIIARARRAS